MWCTQWGSQWKACRDDDSSYTKASGTSWGSAGACSPSSNSLVTIAPMSFFHSNPLSLVSRPSDHCELVALKWAQGKGSLLTQWSIFSEYKAESNSFKFHVFPNESTLKKIWVWDLNKLWLKDPGYVHCYFGQVVNFSSIFSSLSSHDHNLIENQMRKITQTNY